MPALRRQLNHRHIELREIPTRERIGILKRTGGHSYLPWLGFIHVQQAKTLGKPVKLQAVSFSTSYDISNDWQDVPEGKHVQGCLIQHGVYAVLEDGRPRII